MRFSPFVFSCWRAVVLALILFSDAALASDAPVWTTLQSGRHVIFIRHALTESGIGDPAGFTLSDCTTQRNLSAEGRADALLLGQKLRKHKVIISEVLSSRWCRCLDTARIAFGKVTPSVMLDSMFNDPVKPASEKDRELQLFLSNWKAPGNLVMVTHAQNIQHWTGVSARSGEMVVTRFEAGRFKVLERIDPENF